MPLHIDYRPEILDDIVGNELTVRSLKALLKRDAKDVPRALLFSGPSGCGKTTLGRIVAKELGCSETDFYEMDSADFRGIETIREMRKRMQYMPSSGPCRVWLLDECHRLTVDAQEALLKVLEDTPKHVFMMLATTAPEKLRKTLLRRCTPFPVATLSDMSIAKYLYKIAKKEGRTIEKKTLKQIAEYSVGSLGMAMMLLDKVLALDEDDMAEAVERIAIEQSEVIELCRAIIKGHSWKRIASIVKGLDQEPESIRRSVLGYFNQVLLGGNGAAYQVMAAFSEPFYETGKVGLTMACWEATQDSS